MASVLVVEDESVLAKNVKRALERMGHSVLTAGSGAEAERIFEESRPRLTLMDLRLPDRSGLDLLPEFLERAPSTQIIMMTAYASVSDAVEAIKMGACDYLQKPLNMDDLRHAVERALKEAQLETEVSYYRQRDARGAGLENMVGRCGALDSLRKKVHRLCTLPESATPPTILITGETGTGKGVLARTLHYNGPRADRPFVEVNCAAIPENLVESELFGHDRGAFTDAKESKLGLFRAADRGTLFLDEIGTLTTTTQVKILKAIEEKKIRPVGSQVDESVDIQIITATNSDLEEKVAGGEFREDLYYRLRVAALTLPPLRERGDDIEILANHFITELCEGYRIERRELTSAVVKALRGHPWPGNVRELRNTIDHALLFTESATLDVADLRLPRPRSPAIQVDPDGSLSIDIPESGIQFEEIERALITQAMEKAGGNQSAAAKLLGMSRDTLRYRIEKFGVGN